MTANNLPENMEPGNTCALKEDEEITVQDLPEWSDSEAYFPKNEYATLKSSYKAEEMTNDDATYWENEISDLMESLKRFQSNLAESRSFIIDEVFKFHQPEDHKKEKYTGDELKASMAEIEKLDVLLKMKDMEEKKAKLNRLQVEEESRAILTNLNNVTMTTGIKMNSEEFLRLLYEMDKPETGFDEEENKCDDAKEGKKSDNEEDKNTKATGAQQRLKFVERNIQLAKCGRGVLSLTDEEKTRIESLLIDIADPKPDEQKIDNPTKPEFYALDDESKSILSEIDQKLQAFSKEKSEVSPSLLENIKAEEDKIKETGNKNVKNKDFPNRLLAINKLLNGINSKTEKEISPLSQGDINRLIDAASQSMTQTELKPSSDVIAELVSSAKVLMPKFKYKFDED